MAEHALPKDRVARYSGTPLTAAQSRDVHSAYKVQVHGDLILDAQDESEFTGRYINDGPRAGRKPNARFGSRRATTKCPTTGKQWISVFVTRPLKPGDEILVDYGPDYDWSVTTVPQHVTRPLRPAASHLNYDISVPMWNTIQRGLGAALHWWARNQQLRRTMQHEQLCNGADSRTRMSDGNDVTQTAHTCIPDPDVKSRIPEDTFDLEDYYKEQELIEKDLEEMYNSTKLLRDESSNPKPTRHLSNMPANRADR